MCETTVSDESEIACGDRAQCELDLETLLHRYYYYTPSLQLWRTVSDS